MIYFSLIYLGKLRMFSFDSLPLPMTLTSHHNIRSKHEKILPLPSVIHTKTESKI